jgi:hypothetical protein
MNEPSSPGTDWRSQPEQPILFGRDRLLQDIQQRLIDGHKVLLVGPEGIGKSAVIHGLLASGLGHRLGRNVVLCSQSTGVRAIVDAAGGQGASLPEEVSDETDEGAGARCRPGRPKGGVRDRRSSLCRRVQQGRWLFVLDHLSSWDPGIRHLLEFLFEHDALALGAARSRKAADLGNVAKTLWRWDQVTIPSLGNSACQQLLEHLTDSWSLDAAPLQHFRRQLLRLAEGNPGIIAAICRKAEARLVAGAPRIDPYQLWLDWLGERCR